MSEVPEPAAGAEPASFVPPQPEELSVLLPSYDVSKLLALGGMGAVYSGVQRDLERPVAIKVLPPDAARDSESIDRFRTEAKAMARLTHPHIPAVYDFAVVQGFCVLVMELIDGPNVYSLIRAKLLTPPRALQVLAEVCDAVQFAHSRGVIHGDIKPGNILLDADGKVKLADFGLARLMVQGGGSGTDSWTPMGTPEYAAPELYDKNAAPDHRADLYSIGVVLHEMLTGAPPVGEFDLPALALGMDSRVDEVIARCMELQPEKRYQSAAEVRAVLLDIMERRNVPVPEKSATRRITRPGRKVPPGARRRGSQQKLTPPTQQKLSAGPPTVVRAAGPPTVAPVARRRRKVVVVESGRSASRGGMSDDLKRNLLVAAAGIVVLLALWFILTTGNKPPVEDKKTGSKTPPSTPEVRPDPGPAPEPVPVVKNDPRPEPKPDPKTEPNPFKPAEPPPSKVYAKFHEMKIAWRDEWNSKVESRITAEMATISPQYIEALQKLHDDFLGKGDAASVLAVREEMKRFEKEKTAVKPDGISTIAALGTRQKALNARIEKLQAFVKYDEDRVKEKFMDALQELERRMDDEADKVGGKFAADEFKKVAPYTAAEMRDYLNAPEAEK